jgi:hypothetical protein
MDDTVAFTENLEYATEGNFRINTDGFPAYKDDIVYSLSGAICGLRFTGEIQMKRCDIPPARHRL